MNKIREQIEEEIDVMPEKAQLKPAKSKLILATEQKLSIDKSDIGKALPFILFLTLLAIVYIFNSNYTIRTIRKTDEVSKEIKEYRAEYITVKSDFMYRSKQSQVSKRLEPEGLKELTSPPLKITYDPDKDEY